MSAVKFIVFLFVLSCASHLYAMETKRLSVPVVINGLSIPYTEFAIYLQPDEKFQVNFKDSASIGVFLFNSSTQETVGGASLIAPSNTGNYLLEVQNKTTNEVALINVFVMVPASQVDRYGNLNGYSIGKYPTEPLKGLNIYLPPKGFIEVTKENSSIRVSPNFTLGQFISKQKQGYPKYMVLRPRLLLKLEKILEALNREGHKTESFVIMSGFRTPWYNRSIGNVMFSRHVWGGASDIYIDENPKDGVMDDLNRDGKMNRGDAVWLVKFIDTMSRNGEFNDQIGGLGTYGSNAAHGPFVHVDVRGSRARW